MTRENNAPWFTKAGAATGIMPISHFVSETIFALKGGGYGCLFSLAGIDEESRTDEDLDVRVRGVEASLRGLPPGACLYQYTRVMAGFSLPRQKTYTDPITESFANDRIEFLNQTARFRRIDLHWCLTLEPETNNPLSKKPKEQRDTNDRQLFELEKVATILESHMGDSIGLTLLRKERVFQFFSYLFNLEEWASNVHLRSDVGVDRQLVKAPVEWQSEHLCIGRRYVQMFPLTNTPEISHPCLFTNLMELDCDSILCSVWRPKTDSATRKEVTNQEKFLEFFKLSPFQRLMSGKNTAPLEATATAKAVAGNVDNLTEVVSSLDKLGQGEYALRLLLSAGSASELRAAIPAVHRLFVDARAPIMEETYGNLSAFYAMFPGNRQFNVYPLWLREDHHARLSSIFAPNLGHVHSDDLDAEYLNIFETRTRTPYFQDAYVNGVRVQLIIGPTGTGKTSTLAAIREGAERNGYVVEGFAPTSRAAHQLREAGISADTLQGFLARAARTNDASQKHLYMVDESSLASTEQMRDFLRGVAGDDKVLLIGDVRQHQGVDAGKPFEQLQESGMRSAILDRIVRQQDPELRRAVEHLSKNETLVGVRMLQEQGRVTEIAAPEQRIAAIAKTYAAQPENTIIVSPDNASRRAINQAVRQELQAAGALAAEGRSIPVLAPRSDMTGADRAWAARYEAGDVLHYVRGSKDTGIEPGSYARVVKTDPKENLITVQREDGERVTYDPSRLKGISAYREIQREFSVSDRVQLTAPNRDLQVSNRDLGTLTSFAPDGRITLQMDSGKDVTFDPKEMRHFDHGYAVTSHSSQGLTSQRVLVNMDTEVHPELINARFAYVSVSRASHDAQVFTNDASNLAERLNADVSKTSALDFRKQPTLVPSLVTSQPELPKQIGGLGLGLSQ